MEIQIESAKLIARMDEIGAELHSLVRKEDAAEYIWQRDPAVWSGCAPWLFPIIGVMKDGGYRYGGKRYEMPVHGFVRKAALEWEKRSDSCVVFRYRDNAETRKFYPWHFELEIEYALTDDALEMEARVKNTDSGEMFFSIGAHPGLVCEAGDALEMIGGSGTALYRLNEAHLLRDAPTGRLDSDTLALSETLFVEDAMILKAPAFEGLRLRRKCGRDVEVRFGKIPYLGLWSRGKAPLRYVCVEPWFGVDDPESADGELIHKEAIQTLGAGEQFVQRVRIRIL